MGGDARRESPKILPCTVVQQQPPMYLVSSFTRAHLPRSTNIQTFFRRLRPVIIRRAGTQEDDDWTGGGNNFPAFSSCKTFPVAIPPPESKEIDRKTAAQAAAIL